jgi:alpha-mannosidase
MRRLTIGAALTLLAVIPSVLNGQATKKFYIAMDDHTDYMWSGNVDQYRSAFLQMIDYYLDLADSTAANPSDFQSRFSCDGSYWLWTYQQNKTQAEFDRLIGRLKDGHMSAPMTLLTLGYGGMPAEAVLRSLFYAGRLERIYGLKFKLALAQENQTLPYGLGALWAGAGASYFWKGICGCASRIPNAWDRPYDMYWWSGPDGSRILTKWYSQIRRDAYGIGGYAEARQIPGIISAAETNADFRLRVPYSIIGLFGYGGDDLMTNSDAAIQAARQTATASRRVIVSNTIDFFEDFEASYGDALPTYGAAFGNEWDNLTASLAEVSGSVKRSVEKLRAAEAMAALVNLQKPAFMRAREDARNQAWIGLGMYFEHDWTADGPISRADRAAWQREQAAAFRSYVDTLSADASSALASMIQKDGARTRFFAFNPLSWTRTDVADYLYTGSTPVHVIDLVTGSEAPSQFVTLDGTRYLRIWAENVPSLGYKVFEIVPGDGQSFGGGPTVNGDVLENSRCRVTLAPNGAIRSLQDKRLGGREFVQTVGGLRMNELGPGDGTLSVENAGPVSITLTAVSPAPLSHTTSVTLDRGTDRIDVRNVITQNFGGVETWSFGLNLDAPEVRHEEIGAILKARTLDQGGNYAPRNARYDWLTLNHFADMSGAGAGLTLSAADNLFFQTGFSTVNVLDTTTPKLTVLAGGQVDGPQLGIPDQGGDSRFLQRFALRSHAESSTAAAMRFALEHQNPLVTATIVGGNLYPAASYSLLGIDNPDVVAWSVKPSEDTAAARLIVRLWNMGEAPSTATIELNDQTILDAQSVSHIETPQAALPVSVDRLSLSLETQQWKTVSLALKASASTGKGIGRKKIR